MWERGLIEAPRLFFGDTKGSSSLSSIIVWGTESRKSWGLNGTSPSDNFLVQTSPVKSRGGARYTCKVK